MGYPWSIHGLSMEHPWIINGSFMDNPQSWSFRLEGGLELMRKTHASRMGRVSSISVMWNVKKLACIICLICCTSNPFPIPRFFHPETLNSMFWRSQADAHRQMFEIYLSETNDCAVTCHVSTTPTILKNNMFLNQWKNICRARFQGRTFCDFNRISSQIYFSYY